MHRLTRTALLIVLLLTLSGTLGYAAPPDPTAIVTAPIINVRSGPGTTFAPVTAASQGTVLTIVGTTDTGDWLQVRMANGATGWVFAQLVSRTAAPAVATPATAQPANTCTVTSATVNVRVQPGTIYVVLTQVGQGTVLPVMNQNDAGDWYKVRTADGVEGWVYAQLCSQNAPGTTVGTPATVPVSAAGTIPAYVGQKYQPDSKISKDCQIHECWGGGASPLRQANAGTPIQLVGMGNFQPPDGEAGKLGASPYVKVRIWDGQFAWVAGENVYATLTGLPQVSGTCEEYDRIDWTAVVRPTPVPAPSSSPNNPGSSAPSRSCCKICTTGKACGNTCISRSYTCHVGPGCACNG